MSAALNGQRPTAAEPAVSGRDGAQRSRAGRAPGSGGEDAERLAVRAERSRPHGDGDKPATLNSHQRVRDYADRYPRGRPTPNSRQRVRSRAGSMAEAAANGGRQRMRDHTGRQPTRPRGARPGNGGEDAAGSRPRRVRAGPLRHPTPRGAGGVETARGRRQTGHAPQPSAGAPRAGGYPGTAANAQQRSAGTRRAGQWRATHPRPTAVSGWTSARVHGRGGGQQQSSADTRPRRAAADAATRGEAPGAVRRTPTGSRPRRAHAGPLHRPGY